MGNELSKNRGRLNMVRTDGTTIVHKLPDDLNGCPGLAALETQPGDRFSLDRDARPKFGFMFG